MELELGELKSIPEEVRLRILEHVRAKGVRARDLGVTPNLLIMIRRGKARVSDRLLARALRYLSLEEFAGLVKGEGPREAKPIAEGLAEAVLELDALISKLKALVEAYPQLGSYAYSKILEALRGVKVAAVKVTEDHVQRFEKLLADRAAKTRRLHLHYLRMALSDLGWELDPDRLQEYLLELRERGPTIPRLTASALKKFIKLVLKDPHLYGAFKVPRDLEAPAKEPLSLEEVKAVAKAIDWPPAKAYYCMLAETGLRPGEVLELRLEDVDLDARTVRPRRLTETKRSYVSFISTKLSNYLKQVYLPYREAFIGRYEAGVRNLLREAAEGWKELLFPFKDSTLRASIYAAMDKALGRRFRLYDLRAFFASYMSLKGVPGQVIDILQGRVPPREFRVLAQHYLAFSLEDLRRMYDQAGLSVLD